MKVDGLECPRPIPGAIRRGAMVGTIGEMLKKCVFIAGEVEREGE